MGRHTPDHARALAEADVLRHLLALMSHESSSEDLRTKSKRALKAIINKCTHLAALDALLKDAPPNVQKHVLVQFKVRASMCVCVCMCQGGLWTAFLGIGNPMLAFRPSLRTLVMDGTCVHVATRTQLLSAAPSACWAVAARLQSC